ncbi:mechanosensitive ion channel protein MscS [Methylacidiphilum kamchatkense Kam1]|uniref:Mechanosensitive ion channel protein MscS n=1 Tax=Methylacidiphilum kamchatkense Kam1 TaxID=1202785 RepID=A0A0C1RV26_9BACT|nr:mechanosensitive ion channel domain-containing protein [Methylacidiphilum kamchatkense]KIE58796.1 mechanosensitive ion channel protein MscS [Methylacidiphilum kamchatkense Kam1]QDQ41795.1 small-conductance mechanosensitive channel [Methylacidiphilum kamchatkense Kam1]
MFSFDFSLLYPLGQFGFVALATILFYLLSRPIRHLIEKKLTIDSFQRHLSYLKVFLQSLWLPLWIAILFTVSIVVAIFATIYVEERFSITISFIGLFWGLSFVWYFAFWWFLFRLAKTNLEIVKQRFSNREQFRNILATRLARMLYIVIPVIGISGVFEIYPFRSEIRVILNKIVEILLIFLLAYFFFESVAIGGEFIIHRWKKAENDFTKRKVYTQVKVIERILYFLIILFAVSSILMLFPEVRHIGTSMLASAGVIGIVVGFAAQHIFSNIFAGIQLAITQPIRLGDIVVVQGYWGTIEEITLTYVVVHVWDHRRLVLPISYFTSNFFENWTRHSSEIMGTVYIYVDYSIPVDSLRKQLQEILSSCPLWDQKVATIQVTQATDKAMEVRILLSAENSSKLWDLRCLVREKMIAYLQQTFPQSLPKYRLDYVNHWNPQESMGSCETTEKKK